MSTDSKSNHFKDETDFTKALRVVVAECGHQITHVLALVENSGRLDQIFANIETLFHAKSLKIKVLLISSNSASVLLNPGHSSITVPAQSESSHVGLIPVAGPANQVTTSGLKWNLQNQRLAFGELVSTSNAFATGSQTVNVETDQALLFTMEF